MRYPLSLMAMLLAGTAPVHAQESGVCDLDEIVVSGGLTPFASNAYGRSVSVLTSDDIEDRGLRTIQDALRALPGVSVASVGANYTQVRLRGSESNNVLILLDGVELGGGGEEYIISGLETANVERIEVLRGPQSVFYGSNASSGVINIITRTGSVGTQYDTRCPAMSRHGPLVAGLHSLSVIATTQVLTHQVTVAKRTAPVAGLWGCPLIGRQRMI